MGWNSEKGNIIFNFMYNEYVIWIFDSWGYINLCFWLIDDKKIIFFVYVFYEFKLEVGID